MSGEGEPRSVESARDIILRLAPKRIAGWCDISESAVHQWLCRKADTAEPVPPKHAAAIIRGARAEGLEFDHATLFPALAALARAA